MERVLLDRCQQLLDLVIGGKKAPAVYSGALRDFESFLAAFESIPSDVIDVVRNLERKALDADNLEPAVWEETSQVLRRLAQRIASSTLSVSMFRTPQSKLPRKQHELTNWLTPNFRLIVVPKEVWLRDVDSALVAIRWLSFRAAITSKPEPLVTLAEAIARQKRKRKGDYEEEEGKIGKKTFEREACHYDLLQALSNHAASGQPGIDLQRLRRAENDGEDISVLVNGKKTALEMKRFLNKEITGTSIEKVMALADEIKQLIYYMLEYDQWSGRQTGALIFAHLLFCIQVVFTNGKVEQLTVSPGFPTFCGSKEPMLELYDRNKLYQADSTDPDFVFGKAPSDGFKGLVKLVKSICSTNGVALAPLRFVTDEGTELNVAVGEHLVYSGRNSVVLSCRALDADSPSSVLKVASEVDSRREEGYHKELDKLVGVRRKESSGYVEGAGSGLRFIQLGHYGNAFRASHVSGGMAREFAEQACQTIQSMHQLKVLHRDVKPDNFVVVEGILLLNDFDLSCGLADKENRCLIAGTPLFRSPRLMDGEVYEPVDDWMSLGLTFMYLLGGHSTESTKVVSLRKIQGAAWAPDVLKTNVAAGLQQLVEQENVMETELAEAAKSSARLAEDEEEDQLCGQ